MNQKKSWHTLNKKLLNNFQNLQNYLKKYAEDAKKNYYFNIWNRMIQNNTPCMQDFFLKTASLYEGEHLKLWDQMIQALDKKSVPTVPVQSLSFGKELLQAFQDTDLMTRLLAYSNYNFFMECL
jgi:hypothetical protein